MARAKIYCEITCNNCGALLKSSGYYNNSSIISKLKQNAKEAITAILKEPVDVD